jgi:hypothetical protein
VCDINPQSPNGPPAFLKVDLYAYLTPGRVEFSDVEVKAVGDPTRKATDDAIKPAAEIIPPPRGSGRRSGSATAP